MRRLLYPLVALMGLAECEAPPLPQIVVHVDTDAPVGARALAVEADEPIALFDRLRIQLVPPGSIACEGCTNEIEVTREMFANGNVSFGVKQLTGYRLRLQLFRAQHATTGEPDPNTTIDATFAVPTAAHDAVSHVSAFLPSDRIGLPIDDAQLALGVAATKVGTWERAKRTPCVAKDLAADEACVPGGAFWMGAAPGPDFETLSWHRLAVVPPFVIGTHEITVAEARSAGIVPDGTWSGKDDGANLADWCAFASNPDARRDVLPLNCITWLGARAFCAKTNRLLPTEAQLEYLGGGIRGSPFVWGNDPPSCADVVFARLGQGITASDKPSSCRSDTNWLGWLGGTEPHGHGARDAIAIGSIRVEDVAGNLAEYTRDRWDARTGDCWSGRLDTDPSCPVPANGPSEIVVKGSAWTLGIEAMLAWGRSAAPQQTWSPNWGFRCVRAP